MHRIHKDTLNFDKYLDGDFFSSVELIYEGEKFTLDKKRPTMLIVTGTSGAGKDTIVDLVVEKFEKLEQVQTATTRSRRYEYAERIDKIRIVEFESKLKNLKGEEMEIFLEEAEKEGFIKREPFSKYIWMRGKLEHEDNDCYFENLIKEYDLVEFDHHYGNLYGVPKASVQNITVRGKKPLFRVDVNGAINLSEIFSNDYNILVLTVLPDKKSEAERRLLERKGAKTDSSEYYDIRRSAMQDEYEKFSHVTHFYLHNTAVSKDGVNGLIRSFNAVERLINHLDL